MPKGYIITKWTEEGLAVQLNYPDDIKIDLDDMMKVFYAHITGAGEAGNVLVRLEKARSNVASYFTGMDTDPPYMVNLMLELGEDPEMFGEDNLREINEEIIEYLNKLKENRAQAPEIVLDLREYLKNSLFFLERLKQLSKEQRMAQIYSNKKTRTIMEVLQERARSRKELQNILEEKLDKIVSNLDITLDPFVKTDLIKQDWIEGAADVFLFLQSDFVIMRAPPEKIVEEAKENKPNPSAAKKYLEELEKFFKEYKHSFEDNMVATKNMVNPDKYDYISLFRNKPYPMSKIPKGSGENMQDIQDLLSEMIDDKILTIVKDKKGVEWVFLLTDPIAEKFFPEYMIENIRKDKMEGKLKKNIAIKHLNILENAYPE
ncbi:MAG: hypothetical protein BAJALOKI2v1_90077 [Promethearchaeota archaeon]|nr:MAG: hypothetical protein BAJALOKI2v1_90077 [Candidatus Lokiarchaeota archaeon]